MATDKTLLYPEKTEYLRPEAQMKAYYSARDPRAWCDVVEDRRQHILNLSGRNYNLGCPDSVLPVEKKIGALLAIRQEDVVSLKKKLDYLVKVIDFYENLDLDEEQSQLRKEYKAQALQEAPPE